MKISTLFLILAVPFLLTACGPKTGNQAGGQTEKPANKFSLKNALTAGQSMKCSYEVDGNKVTTSIKGDKFKIDGMGALGETNQGGMVSDGTFMYMWDDKTKKGTKYDIKVMQELGNEGKPEAEKTDNSKFDFQKWADSQEGKYKIDCQPAILTDAEFTPPSDVEFSDITQSMVQLNELSKKMKDNPNEMPSEEDLKSMGDLFKGMGVGSEPTEEPEMTEETDGL